MRAGAGMRGAGPTRCGDAGRGAVGLGRGACVLRAVASGLPLPAAPGFGFASGSGVRTPPPSRASPGAESLAFSGGRHGAVLLPKGVPTCLHSHF